MADAKSHKNIRYFQHGDIIFHEKDKAESLYIVQKGTVRLFLKKGSGYIDLAMVQNGELSKVCVGVVLPLLWEKQKLSRFLMRGLRG